jgi:hypothetical protein
MEQAIIDSVAAGADKLGDALEARGLTAEAVISCVAMAIPALIAYETEAARRREPVETRDRLGRGDIGPRDVPLGAHLAGRSVGPDSARARDPFEGRDPYRQEAQARDVRGLGEPASPGGPRQDAAVPGEL